MSSYQNCRVERDLAIIYIVSPHTLPLQCFKGSASYQTSIPISLSALHLYPPFWVSHISFNTVGIFYTCTWFLLQCTSTTTISKVRTSIHHDPLIRKKKKVQFPAICYSDYQVPISNSIINACAGIIRLSMANPAYDAILDY